MRCVAPSGRLAIGHMMNSTALNELHSTIGGAVGDDHLPPASEVGRMLSAIGATVLAAEEGPESYFVLAGALR
jgi:hypothetical protein